MHQKPLRSLRLSAISVLAFSSCLLPIAAQQGKNIKKPLVEIKQPSIYDGCDILNHGKEHSIVPQKSILYVPESMKSKIGKQPRGKLMLWPSFLKINQNWLWTFEVTKDQASGKTPIPEAKMAEFKKLARVVIATNNGNPIAVFSPEKTKDGGKK